MKAATFVGPGQPITLETVPDPEPGPGEAIVRIGRCGICGSDLHMTESESFGYPPGLRLGHEYAGEVVALGSGCHRLAVGDRVAALPASGCGHCNECRAGEPQWCAAARWMMGGFSEFATIDERYAVKLPQSLTLADGALIEPLAAGRHCCNIGAPLEGKRILVLGAGPFALATVWWLARASTAHIAVAALSNRNRGRALAMGADSFFTNSPDLQADVRGVLGGPPDVVFECVGVPGMLAEAVKHVRLKGTVVAAGLCSRPDTWVPATAMSKEVRIQFANAYAFEDFVATARLLDRGSLEPRSLVTDTISLHALPERFEMLRTDRTQCKVLVDPWS